MTRMAKGKIIYAFYNKESNDENRKTEYMRGSENQLQNYSKNRTDTT